MKLNTMMMMKKILLITSIKQPMVNISQIIQQYHRSKTTIKQHKFKIKDKMLEELRKVPLEVLLVKEINKMIVKMKVWEWVWEIDKVADMMSRMNQEA